MVAPVQFLGKISYSIYMVHTFILTSLAISIKRVFKLPMDVDLATNLTFPRIDPWIGDVLLSAIVLVVVTVSALTLQVHRRAMPHARTASCGIYSDRPPARVAQHHSEKCEMMWLKPE